MSDKFVKQLHAKARKAMKVAVSKALLEHQAAGVPAVIWKNGRVVVLKPKPKNK